MLQFNDLRISDDRKYLIIDVLIKEEEYYNDNYISLVCINNLNSLIETGPNTSSAGGTENWNITESLPTQDNKVRHYTKYIDLDGINVSDTIFFVWVCAGGKVSSDTPCELKDNVILGVAYDKQLLYIKGMSVLNTIDSCYIDSEVLDYILRNKAFEINLKAGNYKKAIEYWKLLTNIKPNSIYNKCGCHGSF